MVHIHEIIPEPERNRGDGEIPSCGTIDRSAAAQTVFSNLRDLLAVCGKFFSLLIKLLMALVMTENAHSRICDVRHGMQAEEATAPSQNPRCGVETIPKARHRAPQSVQL